MSESKNRILSDGWLDEDLEIVTERLLSLVICASNKLSLEEIEQRVQLYRMSGTKAGWVIDRNEGDFVVGCEKYPGRQHILFTC